MVWLTRACFERCILTLGFSMKTSSAGARNNSTYMNLSVRASVYCNFFCYVLYPLHRKYDHRLPSRLNSCIRNAVQLYLASFQSFLIFNSCFLCSKTEVAVLVLCNTVKGLCDTFLVAYCRFATQTLSYTYLLQHCAVETDEMSKGDQDITEFATF